MTLHRRRVKTVRILHQRRYFHRDELWLRRRPQSRRSAGDDFGVTGVVFGFPLMRVGVAADLVMVIVTIFSVSFYSFFFGVTITTSPTATSAPTTSAITTAAEMIGKLGLRGADGGGVALGRAVSPAPPTPVGQRRSFILLILFLLFAV